jgi:peptidyl-dipeptidase A
MLHELNHSVYSSRTTPLGLPFCLKVESHTLTTEGVAMLIVKFGKKAARSKALGMEVRDEGAIDAAPKKAVRPHLLIFPRWCQMRGLSPVPSEL